MKWLIFTLTGFPAIPSAMPSLTSFITNPTQTGKQLDLAVAGKEVELDKIADFEAALLSYMNAENGDLMNSINETGDWNDDTEKAFKDAMDKFISTQTW